MNTSRVYSAAEYKQPSWLQQCRETAVFSYLHLRQHASHKELFFLTDIVRCPGAAAHFPIRDLRNFLALHGSFHLRKQKQEVGWFYWELRLVFAER